MIDGILSRKLSFDCGYGSAEREKGVMQTAAKWP